MTTLIISAETFVLWDTQDCPLPAGLDALDVTKNIESFLREKGFHGDVSLMPYLSVNNTSMGGYSGFGLSFVDEDCSGLTWSCDSRRHRALNLVLILGDIDLMAHGLLRAIHFLKSRFNYNVILTQPQKASGHYLIHSGFAQAYQLEKSLSTRLKKYLSTKSKKEALD
ncbi:hypothetical protein EUTSA_v10022386mg [Eutrema salsugineum]|uniref:NYN domain-containing protein n=1 Tax=Eutrema salsugineum TaxID=72664 RepID=V4LUS9_EUTSA|nr:hypothetical protein EUTSA_v10022386mg [Eutrema salsugineum]